MACSTVLEGQQPRITVLVAEGCRVDPVGESLEPPKLIVFAASERVARIRSARAVPVRLGRDVLEARHLVLTPFEPGP